MKIRNALAWFIFIVVLLVPPGAVSLARADQDAVENTVPALDNPTYQSPSPLAILDIPDKSSVTDDFSSDSGNWFYDGNWQLVGGVLRVAGNRQGVGRYARYEQELTDATVQVDVRRVSGNSDGLVHAHGLRVRCDSSLSNGVFFYLVTDGRYCIYQRVNGTTSVVVDWTKSSAVNTGYGAWNTLKVEMQGAAYSFYINGQLAHTMNDASLASGKPLLYAYDSSTSIDPTPTVEFDNFSVTDGAAQDTVTSYNGWWWESGKPGSAISMEIQGDKLFLAWYAYAATGTPWWYVASCDKQSDGSFSGNLMEYRGWPLGGTPFAATSSQVGTASVSFASYTSGVLAWKLGAVGGSLALSRWMSEFFPGVEDPQGISGWWYDPSYPNMGLFFESHGNTFYAAWFHYRDDGTPRWWTLSAGSGGFPAGDMDCAGTLYEWKNGQIFGGAYLLPTSTAGHAATLAFSSATKATLSVAGITYNLERFRFGSGSTGIWESTGTVTPSTGASITGQDGSQVTFPSGFASSSVDVSWSLTTECDGASDGDYKTVSGSYNLKLSNEDAVTKAATITLPLDTDALPSTDAGQIKANMVVEYLDPDTGLWKTFEQIAAYDASSTSVSVSVPVPQLVGGNALAAARRSGRLPEKEWWKPIDWDVNGLSARIRYRMGNASGQYDGPGSGARLKYYPPTPANDNSILDNTAWAEKSFVTDPYKASSPYNYINDLAEAYHLIEERLDAVRDFDGNAILDAPTMYLVYVLDIGEDNGQSPLGGPILLSNKQITNWLDMRSTAAHEYVHLLQGTNLGYGTLESFGDRWFIEAMAQYYSALCLGTTDATALNKHFTDGASTLYYLSEPITYDDTSSFYSLGHFLYWLANKQYDEAFVADLVSKRPTNNSLSNMMTLVTAEGDTLVNVYAEYVEWLLTDPDDANESIATASIKVDMFKHNLQRKALYGDATNYYDVDTEQSVAGLLSRSSPYKLLKKSISPMATTYVNFKAQKNDPDGLLVVRDLGSSSGSWKSWLLASDAYNMLATSDYDAAKQMDEGKAFPWSAPMTLDSFGGDTASYHGVENVIINKASPDAWLSSTAWVEYYVLFRPTIELVEAGKITWGTAGVAKNKGIPAERIEGYDVYTKEGTKLNSTPIVPTTDYSSSFSDSSILAGDTSDDYVVVLVDTLGNQWPTPPESSDVPDVIANATYIVFDASYILFGVNRSLDGKPPVVMWDPHKAIFKLPTVSISGHTVSLSQQTTSYGNTTTKSATITFSSDWKTVTAYSEQGTSTSTGYNTTWSCSVSSSTMAESATTPGLFTLPTSAYTAVKFTYYATETSSNGVYTYQTNGESTLVNGSNNAATLSFGKW